MEAALIVLDGWGLGPADDPAHRNAVAAADTPTVDRLGETAAAGRLSVSGRDVGLPAGQMGNSEVGHLNIGAGRVVYHEYTRINDAIRASDLSVMRGPPTADVSVPFDRNPAFLEVLEDAAGRVHILGLASDGGVHADLAHLEALVELVIAHNLPGVIHAFTDGRDTDPTSGAGFLRELATFVDGQDGAEIASVSGRYYAMDRDANWERTARAYDAIVAGEARHDAGSAVQAVEAAYDRGETDEFVVPTTIGGGTPAADGDGVIFANFRGDRARQLVRMLGDIRSEEWRSAGQERDPPALRFATMTEYDRTFPFPVAFPPKRPTETLGAVLADAGRTQFRIAESEKYAHVTYFLNGGREVEFDGEIRRIVESPDVPTYDQQPEMSATPVTDEAVQVIEDRDPAVMVLNYANPDMVGHTGDFEAAVTAVETVDTQLGRLLEAIRRAGAHTIVTADHGNADDMGTAEDPHTAHTANDVPFFYLSPEGDGAGMTVPADGRLADLAPTLLSLLDIPGPEGMNGRVLLSPAQGNP